MKNIKNILLSALCVSVLATSCIQEILPQTSTVTAAQAAAAPGAYDNFVNALTSTLTGKFIYAGSDYRPYDIGLPGFYLVRDVMGQDIVYPYQNWFSAWYGVTYLGPTYAYAQLPWTVYYKWIKSCNTVISLAKEGVEEGGEPAADKQDGLGIAYAMRAFYYMDMARMFAQKPYTVDQTSETVPIVTETTALEDLPHNPRATNADMWAFIVSDLDLAEKYIANYNRADITTPDLSVVYGLKARAYLEMGDWKNAQTYAKKAQSGYRIMTKEEYTSWETGFNTPNASWMFGMTYKADDPQITNNDADSSWGSMMCMEINPETSGCGYAANYGQAFFIDRHLYESMPLTDFRRDCFVDFAIDDLDEAGQLAALANYTAHPDWIYGIHNIQKDYAGRIGGTNLKFRTAGGEAGRNNQYLGFLVSVPIMRVEEMYLIEAEAAGMQNEAEGRALLETFARTRDANYVYGTHKDAYYNTSTPQIQNECWWQRRVEFWGEGFATFDIKRLQKGVIRSYAGTNHGSPYRYNSQTTPDWMNFCIIQTEGNYNYSCTNNPDPINPGKDSEEFEW